ncbi:acyl-CoA ligase (AMP-forming), exosortase A system-associated [Flocculibacter collagenilyticus]|uniref:acyl-CoA ligase (AMP-forming), exosortase A system-associated n=1 Tax=Flocculibacter collagenilyticus TaxID=2744479 RepID=UPI0018F785FD|nr:acyl-CoA ligase (AMP-forming), exosortase A system-associated [Flocculibacter collagenilyticus]
MITFVHDLILAGATQFKDNIALKHKDTDVSYQALSQNIQRFAQGISALGLQPQERVAVFLPKLPQTIYAFFGTSLAGGVFVPVNPVLKAEQVKHILNDCNVRVLVTSKDRLKALSSILSECQDLKEIILIDDEASEFAGHIRVSHFDNLPLSNVSHSPVTDNQMAAILYTSGSTGKPKGVVISHRNMVVGAQSVSTYLENTAEDNILAILPLSFDYGLSQLTSAFNVGATAVLLDYFLANDVVKAVEKYSITGIAAVPPLWMQLTKLNWPKEVAGSVRYFTNSGGAMPEPLLASLRDIFHQASPYLMYGLTEAFRSTYLPPQDVDSKPGSMGKAIPNAKVIVVNDDGDECVANEPGELVHLGPLVSLGYWNAPEKTAERFKLAPTKLPELCLPEYAVWSGDRVKKDEDGYLYFVGRKDEMIKTSGYRVSPNEIEEEIYQLDANIHEVAAFGVTHPTLGQAIVVTLTAGAEVTEGVIMKACKKQLPNFMVPHKIVFMDKLPRNANGKIDRTLLSQQHKEAFVNG